MDDSNYEVNSIVGLDGDIRMKVADAKTGKYVFGVGSDKAVLTESLKCQLDWGMK